MTPKSLSNPKMQCLTLDIQAVGKEYGLRDEEVLAKRNPESRMVAIHLLKAQTAMTNAAIGELCDGISYSAVSQVHRRCRERADSDRPMRRRIAAIKKKLSHVKYDPAP
jgi:chromosomal replication initiation ATPase DnaA